MFMISIVTPIYNDWPSFWKLAEELDRVCNDLGITARIIAVDDASISEADAIPDKCEFGTAVKGIEIVRLACNMGHQRAIAVGLVIAAERTETNCIIVMDSDGEDRPEDLGDFISASERYPDNIICARRSERSEGAWFHIGYWIYKRLFLLLTGETIDFGNFCLIPNSLLSKITHSFDTWNHLPASILRSRLPVQRIDVPRGTRYAGASKMNPTALVVHGLSAIAVFGDRSLVRLLTALSGLVGGLIAGIVIVIVVRFGTDLAIPGWTTTVFGFFGVFLFQLILIAIISVLSLLNNRSTPQVIPAADALRYIAERKPVHG